MKAAQMGRYLCTQQCNCMADALMVLPQCRTSSVDSAAAVQDIFR
jgi:hypothetical protein